MTISPCSFMLERRCLALDVVASEARGKREEQKATRAREGGESDSKTSLR